MKNYLVMAGIGLVAALVVVMFVPRQVVNQVSQLGAVSSPNINSPYFSFGGVRYWGAHTESLNQATTTVCALQSPAATSTLQYGGLTITYATSSAVVLRLSKASTYNSTTTSLASSPLAAGARGTIIASSTGLGVNLDGTNVFSPNQWFIGSIEGGQIGVASPTGICQAVWIQNDY